MRHDSQSSQRNEQTAGQWSKKLLATNEATMPTQLRLQMRVDDQHHIQPVDHSRPQTVWDFNISSARRATTTRSYQPQSYSARSATVPIGPSNDNDVDGSTLRRLQWRLLVDAHYDFGQRTLNMKQKSKTGADGILRCQQTK